jgi:uncharacterized membrane protein YqiK
MGGADFIFIFAGFCGLIILGMAALLAKTYKKVPQGKALVRTGVGGTKVVFTGGMVFPVLHQYEMMDISVKSIEIQREAKNGLICRDNLRADIRVVFFVRVNPESVQEVAQSIGCSRASDKQLLETLFEAKFSEALKTVGKQFDFVDLYNSREELNKKVRAAIGINLNGYMLEDVAIDYLEQTPLEYLDANNILDSEGIRKITELTAIQHIHANQLRNEEVKRIKQQDVARQEAVLELERQQAEAEAKQQREVSIIRSREEAESEKIRQEERLKMENARIHAEEEIGVAEQNKARQIIVAEKNKQKTEAVEAERLEKDRQLEMNERERIVELARIEKERALEEERRNIQDVIRERVVVEKAVVQEEEKIKDTRAFAQAEREKAVAIKLAEMRAEESLVQELKSAEAAKEASKLKAEQSVIQAEAEMASSEKLAMAKKTMAEASASEIAAQGMAEAQVLQAKAEAEAKRGEAEASVIVAKAQAEAKGIEMRGEAQAQANEKMGAVEAELSVKRGMADANVLEQRMTAEAKGLDIKAAAVEKYGLAEAKVMETKALIEAQRIKAEAEAMKAMDAVTADMERFRLNLNARKDIELARIQVQQAVAEAQAKVLAEALKSAKIDIVGGESMFFDNMMKAISGAKSMDAYVQGSEVLSEVKTALLGTGTLDGGTIGERIKGFLGQFGMTSEDVKNLSIAALMGQLTAKASDGETKGLLGSLLKAAQSLGIADKQVGNFL